MPSVDDLRKKFEAGGGDETGSQRRNQGFIIIKPTKENIPP